MDDVERPILATFTVTAVVPNTEISTRLLSGIQRAVKETDSALLLHTEATEAALDTRGGW